MDEKHRDTKSDRHLLSMIHNRRSTESGSDQIETEVQTDAESQEGSKKVRKKSKEDQQSERPNNLERR